MWPLEWTISHIKYMSPIESHRVLLVDFGRKIIKCPKIFHKKSRIKASLFGIIYTQGN